MLSPHFNSNVVVTLSSFMFFTFISHHINIYFTKSLKSYIGLKPKIKQEWINRNSSTFHAIVASVLSAAVVISERVIYDDPLWGSSWKAEAVTSITLGYILADFFYLLASSPSTTDAYWTSLLHHIGTIYCYSTIVIYGCFAYIAIVRLLGEASTPFVNTRWILDVCGMKNTKSYTYNGVLMVVVFFLCRIVAMPYCYVIVLQLRNTEAFAKLGYHVLLMVSAALIDFMNLYWFKRMVNGMLKYIKLSKMNKSARLKTG